MRACCRCSCYISLYLPYISRYLPYISPTSRLYLPISPHIPPHISSLLQVLVLLEDAERVKGELTKQEEAAARLEDLGKP